MATIPVTPENIAHGHLVILSPLPGRKTLGLDDIGVDAQGQCWQLYDGIAIPLGRSVEEMEESTQRGGRAESSARGGRPSGAATGLTEAATREKAAHIHALRRKGVTWREVARQVGLEEKAAQRWAKVYPPE